MRAELFSYLGQECSRQGDQQCEALKVGSVSDLVEEDQEAHEAEDRRNTDESQ